MNTVDNFILEKEGNQQLILIMLKDFLDGYPELVSKIRFNIPFYYGKRWVCYLNPIKKDGIEFVFMFGKKLEDESGLLDATGRKQVAGLTLYEPNEIPFEVIADLMDQAITIDNQHQ